MMPMKFTLMARWKMDGGGRMQGINALYVACEMAFI